MATSGACAWAAVRQASSAGLDHWPGRSWRRRGPSFWNQWLTCSKMSEFLGGRVTPVRPAAERVGTPAPPAGSARPAGVRRWVRGAAGTAAAELGVRAARRDSRPGASRYSSGGSDRMIAAGSVASARMPRRGPRRSWTVAPSRAASWPTTTSPIARTAATSMAGGRASSSLSCCIRCGDSPTPSSLIWTMTRSPRLRPLTQVSLPGGEYVVALSMSSASRCTTSSTVLAATATSPSIMPSRTRA